MDSGEKQKQAQTTRATEQQKAWAKNLADFGAKKEEVIKPAFQEIVDLYNARGITLRIVEEDERPNDGGGIQSPSIGLDMAGFYPSRNDMKPHFTLMFENLPETASLLDDITPGWIQDAFLKYQS